MKPITTKLILIAKDDFPLEQYKNSPIVNFLRRWIHGDHYECKQCYELRKNIKVADHHDQ